MRIRIAGIGVAAGLTLCAPGAVAQEFFRCTTAEGKVTYQQVPCPKSATEHKVDATPANTEYDSSGRERLLQKGDEAGKKLEARAAEEEAERRRRQAQRERDEQLEREAIAREEAREPTYIWANPPLHATYPRPGYPPVLPPRPNVPVPAPR